MMGYSVQPRTFAKGYEFLCFAKKEVENRATWNTF